MHDPSKLIRGLQVGLSFLKCLNEDENGPLPLMGITIKHIQETINYLDHVELNETPDECPSCSQTPCIVDDGEKDLVHIGCRQAFVSRAEGDEHCADHPSLMGAASKKDAVAGWNSWVAGRTNKAENKETV
jgi:hypothetical protein